MIGRCNADHFLDTLPSAVVLLRLLDLMSMCQQCRNPSCGSAFSRYQEFDLIGLHSRGGLVYSTPVASLCIEKLPDDREGYDHFCAHGYLLFGSFGNIPANG